jgi:ParB-like chromosome segregation protein Spo0J
MDAMPRLRIADLLAAAPVDPEAHPDAARVERYAEAFDDLPPMVVFETPEGLLLVDGYHRVAAVRRLGLETVEAEVRRGSRREALRYVARVSASESGISPKEAASHIERRIRGRSGPKCSARELRRRAERRSSH